MSLQFPSLAARNTMLFDYLLRNCSPESVQKYIGLIGRAKASSLLQPTRLFTLLQRYIASMALRKNATINPQRHEMYATVHFVNSRQSQNAFHFDLLIHIGTPVKSSWRKGLGRHRIELEPVNHTLLESISLDLAFTVAKNQMQLTVCTMPVFKWSLLATIDADWQEETVCVGQLCCGAAAALMSAPLSNDDRSATCQNTVGCRAYEGNYLFGILIHYRREFSAVA